MENITATNVSDLIDLSGDHIGGRTNLHVESVQCSQTARLEEIPMNIFATFFNLEQFDCSTNHIRRIDLPFCGPRMKTLNINDNLSLTLLQNGAFRGCGSIEIVFLVVNGIERIEDNAFEDLPLLREVTMFGNPMVDIQGHLLRNQRQLEYARFDQGTISSIQPGAFQCKEFLYFLNLQVNRIEKISTGTFTNMPRLRNLNLATNSIRVIEEGAFANLPLLERLELNENQITVVDSNLFGTSFPNLRYLGFGTNQIQSVDRRLFRRFPVVNTFYGVDNVCFSQNFLDIQSIETDVYPHLEVCFRNFDDL